MDVMERPPDWVAEDVRKRLGPAATWAVLAFPVGMLLVSLLAGRSWSVNGWGVLGPAFLLSAVAGIAAFGARTAPIQLGLMAAEVLAFNSLMRGPGGVFAIPFILGFGVLGGWMGGKLVLKPVALDDVPGGANLLARMAVGLGVLGVAIGFIPVDEANEEVSFATQSMTSLSPAPDPCVAAGVPVRTTGGEVGLDLLEPVALGRRLPFRLTYAVNVHRAYSYVVVHPAGAFEPVFAGALGPVGSNGEITNGGWNGERCGPADPGTWLSAATPGEYVARGIVVSDGMAWESAPVRFRVAER